ncbi:hypothetical protein GCM10010246_14580 [Streptomyces cuspidosporus]|uniref:Uncharacterized protein n=1 Tax=Streptomyces cuspidosporus TaxID=66882 RepID=A0ABN3FKF5_9ACTN
MRLPYVTAPQCEHTGSDVRGAAPSRHRSPPMPPPARPDRRITAAPPRLRGTATGDPVGVARFEQVAP